MSFTYKCFVGYFTPIVLYIKGALDLAKENEYSATAGSTIVSASLAAISVIWNTNYFGVSNLLVLIVIATILFNTHYGVLKSKKESATALYRASTIPDSDPEHKKQMKVHEMKKFDPKRLNYVMFKCITFLAYLIVVKILINDGAEDASTWEQILDFSTLTLTKVPVALFWYNEFKSLGENSTEVYGKKSYIFTIAEKVFEPRISKFFKSTKP